MEDGGLEFRSPDEGGGSVCSGLIGLHLKIALVDELFTISRNWLTLGGTVPPGSARPRSRSIRIQKTKDPINTHSSAGGWVMVGEREGLIELTMAVPEPASSPALSRVLGTWLRSALRQVRPVATQCMPWIPWRQGQAKHRGSPQVPLPCRPGWWAHLALLA